MVDCVNRKEESEMKQRIDYYKTAPDGMKHLLEMEKYLSKTEIDKNLRELIKIRASQINGCAFCLNLHSSDARKLGETEQRIYCISAWRECDFYTDAEKVALELTEAITLISDLKVPEDLYARVRDYYDEKEYVELVLLITQINSWNRVSISMGNFSSSQN